MRTLVLGGIRSGKSEWAESTIRAAGEEVRYIATGASSGGDGSWQQRIADHRRRRPPRWTTVESADVAAELRHDRDSPTLVDDLGGWLTGLLDRLDWGAASTVPAVDELVGAVDGMLGALVLVSPEVGLSVVPATAAGSRFADELGTLNRRLAEVCEQVVLIVAGHPLWVKR